MNPVLDAIHENLQHVHIIFEPTVESFKNDRKQTADSRETTVAELLRSFFPSTYSVSKGPIYALQGHSNEIDCVLLAPNHPPLTTPKRSVILAEGVHAAIEVKPDISTLRENSELHRGLEQVSSVKRLERQLPSWGINTPKRPVSLQSIPTFLFSAKSKPCLATMNYLRNCVSEGVLLPVDLPDAIVTLDNGVLFHTNHASHSIFAPLIKQTEQERHQRFGEEVFIAFEEPTKALSVFLLILHLVPPPDLLLTDPILKRYLIDLTFRCYVLPTTLV